MNDLAITVNSVSKDFILPHEKITSVKSAFTGFYKKRSGNVEMQHALHDISFEIKKGEFFGIVGRNGSGKSTMLKILANIYQPTKGQVATQGKLVPFIELGVGFNPELTGRENVYLNGAMLGFARKEIDAMYDDIVSFAELERFMDQKLKNYSSGMQVRLAFSMATRSEADILLIDEVLAVGDADFQRKCFDYFRQLKRRHKTVVFVSHDMDAVREYCDRAVLIEKSKLVLEGTASKVAAAYTKMFTDTSHNTTDEKSKANNRWGDETVTYTSIEVDPKTANDDNGTITVRLQAKAHRDVEDAVFGFLIKNASGTQVLGTNTKIRKQPATAMKAGQTVTVEWTVPNVFADGTHYIDPAIVYGGGRTVSDWWEEAKSFKVLRAERTPYIISPSISVNIQSDK